MNLSTEISTATALTTASYHHILPDDVQDQLIQAAQDEKQERWSTGDIVNALLRFYAAHPAANVSVMQVYSAVAAFRGKTSRSIRSWAALSTFYPPSVREEYSLLAYEHFRFAAHYPTLWRDILEFAVQQVEVLGRPATVDMLRVVFQYGLCPPEPESPPTPLPAESPPTPLPAEALPARSVDTWEMQSEAGRTPSEVVQSALRAIRSQLIYFAPTQTELLLPLLDRVAQLLNLPLDN